MLLLVNSFCYTTYVIKAIIFDCFGVLTEDGWLAFCHTYMNDSNQEALRYINHQADKGLVSYEQFLDTVCELTGAPRSEAHQVITTMHHPNKPLFQYIQKLKQADYTLGIISNVGDELTSFLPQTYVNLFDEITLSYHVHAIKPDPVIYNYHLEKLGLPAKDCVFIDDREPNVAGARQVGMQALLYKNVKELEGNLQQLCVKL